MTARVGLIIPSSNRMVEQEMARFFPPGVALHVARLRMTGPHHVALGDLLPRIEEATRTLTDAKCDIVAFHCTATSMEEGMDGEELHAVGRALAGSDAYCATPPEVWRDRVIAAARREAEAYLLSCANIAALGIIAELERRLDRPVVTSNQAVLWDALVRLGGCDLRAGPGRLFGSAGES